ncbi:MAG: ligand-binding protein SH3 [Spirochaetales bacterium]|nr:MAG: ligand-binding protein SH3 [Spirochaetales bacterium]
MTLHTFLFSGILSLLPISELRGAIPYALAKGVPWYAAYLFCVALNALIAPLLFLFLSTLHRLLLKIRVYEKLIGRLIERARTKIKAKVERFGYWGIMIFVAIPLPVTGAYTGTLGAWILGLNMKKTILAVAAGVVIAGVIVTVISVFGIQAVSFFTKKIG